MLITLHTFTVSWILGRWTEQGRGHKIGKKIWLLVFVNSRREQWNRVQSSFLRIIVFSLRIRVDSDDPGQHRSFYFVWKQIQENIFAGWVLHRYISGFPGSLWYIVDPWFNGNMLGFIRSFWFEQNFIMLSRSSPVLNKTLFNIIVLFGVLTRSGFARLVYDLVC